MSQIFIFTLLTVHLVILHTIQLFTFLTATYDTYRSSTLLVYVIIRFRVQFGINLHLWAFWKTHKCKLIWNWTRKTVWLLINNTNMKKCARKKCRKMFLETFFPHSRKLFSEFPYKIFVIASHEITVVQNFSLSFWKSKSMITMCNLYWCYSFCTGVTLKLHCSQPIRIEYFFSYVLLSKWINSYVHIYKIVYIQIAYTTYY